MSLVDDIFVCLFFNFFKPFSKFTWSFVSFNHSTGSISKPIGDFTWFGSTTFKT